MKLALGVLLYHQPLQTLMHMVVPLHLTLALATCAVHGSGILCLVVIEC